MHGIHDDGRGEELAEGRSLRRVVFLGRQEGLQLLADGLPAWFVLPGLPIREDRQGDRAETPEPGKYVPFIGSGPPVLVFEGFQRAYGREDVAGLGHGAGRREE